MGMLVHLVLAVLVLVATTVICDGIHASLHAALHLKGPLRWPGLFHQAHHRFLDEHLAFHEDRFWRNVLLHQIPELLMRLGVLLTLSAIVDVDDGVIGFAVAVSLMELRVILLRRGRDAFHDARRPVGPPRPGFLVDAAYHAHHHAFPEHFLSAHVQVIDRLAGRLLPLQDRAVLIVGGSRFCADLALALTAEGARVARCADEAVDIAQVAASDIVVLGHGAAAHDDRAYDVIVTRALGARATMSDKVLPLDVWAVGDSPAWAARRTLSADRAIIRTLRRGPMLGAQRTLFWLKRGLRTL